MTYCQVWWPILETGALHLTHPSAHTQQWVVNKHTHTLWIYTHSSGQPLLQHPGSNWGFGALLNPHLQFLPVRESNQRPSGYKPNSLTIRPQLPCAVLKILYPILDSFNWFCISFRNWLFIGLIDLSSCISVFEWILPKLSTYYNAFSLKNWGA